MYALNIAKHNYTFMDILSASDFLLRDGVGVELPLILNGVSPGANNNGTDLIPEILFGIGSDRIFLLGSEQKVLVEAELWITNKTDLEVAGAMNGFDYSSQEYVERIKNSSPDIILLAMGMPKQELLVRSFLDAVIDRGLFICGGAIFNFLTNNERRAPLVVRNMRLEWFWRFLLNPRRLFYRYFVGGIVYFFDLIVYFFRK
jgi:exopolysaccharide biosynthesis WecB/TagA/CpsF family protein